MIGQVAGRIQFLAGGTGGNQYGAPGQFPAADQILGIIEDTGRIRQFPLSFPAAGQFPDHRRHEMIAMTFETRLIFTVKRIVPHVDVHGGNKQDGSFGRHQ